MLKGQQIRTDKVHFAAEKRLHGRTHLVQLCGSNTSQHLALEPVPSDTPVNCGRCVTRPSDRKPTTPQEESAMTTTVRKGTNRPAATAKRTRAAQRTPRPTPATTVPEDFPGAKKIMRLVDGAREAGWEPILSDLDPKTGAATRHRHPGRGVDQVRLHRRQVGRLLVPHAGRRADPPPQ